MRPLVWSYGLTTVPVRAATTLPITMASLARAGFSKPRLFIDGATDTALWGKSYPSLGITCRTPSLRTYGTWILALAELYIRQPNADRYAMFQDDFVAVRNLREFLERGRYPANGYQNLFTFDSNELIRPAKGGWYESALLNPRDGSKWQTGRGAVALVFSNEAARVILQARNMHDKPKDIEGWKRVDGAVVTAMNQNGWREWVHSPSLTQHIGKASSMGSKPHRPSKTFPGESFDALTLLT